MLLTLKNAAQMLQVSEDQVTRWVQTKASVYRSLIDALPLPDTVDRAHLLQVLLARESLCPTGMGDGLAGCRASKTWESWPSG